jgi:hypothetical protein
MTVLTMLPLDNNHSVRKDRPSNSSAVSFLGFAHDSLHQVMLQNETNYRNCFDPFLPTGRNVRFTPQHLPRPDYATDVTDLSVASSFLNATSPRKPTQKQFLVTPMHGSGSLVAVPFVTPLAAAVPQSATWLQSASTNVNAIHLSSLGSFEQLASVPNGIDCLLSLAGGSIPRLMHPPLSLSQGHRTAAATLLQRQIEEQQDSLNRLQRYQEQQAMRMLALSAPTPSPDNAFSSTLSTFHAPNASLCSVPNKTAGVLTIQMTSQNDSAHIEKERSVNKPELSDKPVEIYDSYTGASRISSSAQAILPKYSTSSSTKDDIIMSRKKDSKWLDALEELKKYKEEKGDCIVPRGYTSKPRLASWVAEQR